MSTSFAAPSSAHVSTSARSTKARWPWFGAAAGVLGLGAAFLSVSSVTEQEAATGVAVLDRVDRAPYHASFVLGLASVAALLLTASGWRRWAARRASDDLAARTIGSALTAVATINVVFACLAGSMALYLPGGMDEGWLTRESMYINYTLLDFGQLLGWWGAMVAAGCVAVLSLRRERALPRWMGVVSIVLMLPPLAMAVIQALPGFVGFTMPVWLIVVSVAMAVRPNDA